MKKYKFIFTGTPGAGKTTAIATISEIAPIVTDVAVTDDIIQIKQETTAALDYGEITLADNQKIILYGTPGQERFKFMWEIIIKGGLGLIILLDNTRSNLLIDLQIYLDNFSDFIKQTDAIIGVTHIDDGDHEIIDHIYELLNERGEMYPVLPVDARNREDVLLLLDTLMTCLEHETQ
jgi:signal recognition particle receptor subunit beta